MNRKIVAIEPTPRGRAVGGEVSPERWIRGGAATAVVHKRLTIDVHEDLHRRLRVLAATEGRTMAAVVRDLLEEACADGGRLP